MLYFFYGDRREAKDKLEFVKASLLKKKPDALALSFSSENASSLFIEEVTLSRGLFEGRYIVELNSLFSLEIFTGQEEHIIKLIASSDNIFLVYEEKLPAKILSLFRVHAEKSVEIKKESVVLKEFSAFSLSDALLKRDKKLLWVVYREAVARGYAIEELYGILFWQMKTILATFLVQSAEEAMLKPFVFNKAKRAQSVFTHKEAQTLLSRLSGVFLRGRSGESSLENELEAFILEL